MVWVPAPEKHLLMLYPVQGATLGGHPNLTRPVVLSLLPLLISAAWADIPPTPPAGKQFTTYSIQVDGLEGFPDAVLVAYDKDTAELRGYEAFKAGDSKHMLVNGNNSRGQRFSKPDLYFMTAAAFAAWAEATSVAVEEQRTACDERGEGCAHISRFMPRIAPPADAVPCNASIQIRTTAPVGGATAYLDVFTVTAASAGGCTVTGPAEPASAAPASAPSAGVPPEPSAAESRCAAVTGTGSGVAWGLAMLLAGARRRRRRG